MSDFNPNDYLEGGSKDPKGGGGSSSTTAPPSLEELLAEVDKGTKSQREKIAKQSSTAAGEAGLASGRTMSGIDSFLTALSVVPAGIAAATTPDDYLVGERGNSKATRRLGDLSLAEQLLGPNQLSLADPLKSLFTDEKTQRDYLAGTESGATNFGMKALEGAGLALDMAIDPLNFVSMGAGMADDGLKLLDDAARVETVAARLAERAGIDGVDSFAARGLAEIEKFKAATADADRLLASGALDEATALSTKEAAQTAFRQEFARISGEEITSGGQTLKAAQFTPTGTITEAPTGAKARASLATERLTSMAQDVAAAKGISVDAAANLKLAPLGNRTINDAVRDVYVYGYRHLPAQAQEAMGLTGRLNRANATDILSGRAFNPFSTKASKTLAISEAQLASPLAVLRRAGISDPSVPKFLALAQPGIGRSGQLWKAALASTIDDAAVKRAAIAKFEKIIGTSFEKMTPEQISAYPLSLLNVARLDGLVRSGGKALSSAARRAQQEMQVYIDREPKALELIGAGVRPTRAWGEVEQAAFEAADGAVTGAKGKIRERLAEALDAAMRRADIPVDVEMLERGAKASTLTKKVAHHLTADPEYGADLAKISADFAAHLGAKDLGEEDLLRVSLNALSNAVTISKDTDGVFSWAQALSRVESAKDLFSPRGAEELGKAAKLLQQMEQIGLAVVDRQRVTPMTTKELHAAFNDVADRMIDSMNVTSVGLDDLLQTRKDLMKGLKQRGVTAERLRRIEDALEQDVLDRESFRSVLSDAMSKADRASGELTSASEIMAGQKRILADIEWTANRLEQTHLSIVNYRSLDEAARRTSQEWESAAEALNLGTVTTAPLKRRLDEMLDPTMPTELMPPASGVGRGSRTRAASLLRMSSADEQTAYKAARQWQRYNRFLGFARDVFGDTIDLDVIGIHAPTTNAFTRGYNQTEGAINDASIARFFQDSAHPKMTAFVDENGGWLRFIKDAPQEKLDELERIAKAVQSSNKALTSAGVDRRAFTEFVTTNLATAIDAIRPLVDDTIVFLETGRGSERMQEIFVGANGPEILMNFRNGDLSFLNTLVGKVGDSLDVSLGMIGAFGDAEKFAMVREVIQGDPGLRHSFEQLRHTIDMLDNSNVYARELAAAQEVHNSALETLDRLLLERAKTDPEALDLQRFILGNRLEATPDLTKLGRDVKLSEEEVLSLRTTLREARKEIRATEGRLARLDVTDERLLASRQAGINRLVNQDAMLGHLDELVNERTLVDVANGMAMARQIDTLEEVPLAAVILGGSKDFQVVSGGFAAFANDPKVAFRKNSAGVLVRRTDDQILNMWKRRVDGASTWVDTLRDRAVNGYTRGGRKVGPITQYDETDRLFSAWLEDQSERGFGTVWRGAALADDSAALAMATIALNQRNIASSPWGAALEQVTGMLKAQFVGSASFSPGNLMGATIENLRQGVNPVVSKKVWAADDFARVLEGAASRAATMEDGAEKIAANKVLETAEAGARKRFGEIFDLVVEARREAGVTESVLFQEVSGTSLVGDRAKFRQSVKNAWGKAKLTNEARFGASNLDLLAGGTAAVGEIPSYWARKWEHALAGNVERAARGGSWKQILDNPDDLKLFEDLVDAARPFTARPGVEALARIDLYTQRRLAGDSIERAFDRVMESHFDYSDLGSFDAIARRVIPFWVWRSRSIAHYGEMMLHRPALAKTTFGLWNENRRGEDERTPMAFQSAGGGIDQNSQFGLAVPDPANDLLDLLDMAQGQGTDSVYGSIIESLNPALRVPIELGSGTTASGVPLDTPIQMTEQFDAIANSGDGGRAVIEKVAYRKNGKWYWRSAEAPFLMAETFPLLNNVTKLTRPWSDGDSYNQKIFGMIARFMGSPVRAVPEAEQDRAERGARMRERMERQDAARRR